MASTVRPRRQPCTGCGDTVVTIESRATSFGGLIRPAPRIVLQHADPDASGVVDDGVDGACRRPRVRPARS